MGNFSKNPGIPRLNRIAIVCNSPVNESKELNTNGPDKDAFATAKACGFNVVMYPGSEVLQNNQWIEYMDQALINCKKLGIKLISNSPILNYTGKKITDWHTTFVQHYIPKDGSIDLTEDQQEFQDALDALVGWQFKDEPLYYNLFAPYHYYIKEKGNRSTIMTPEEVTEEDLKHLVQEPEDGMSKKLLDDWKIPDQGLHSLVTDLGLGSSNGSNNNGSNDESKEDYTLRQENCEDLSVHYKTIKGFDTNRPVFANLAVDSHLDVDKRKIWIGHNSTYSEFLDEYIREFRPPLLSFDYYPIETINGDEVFHEDAFYQNLLMFANKSKQHNIPFWAYCLCLEHLSGPGGRYFPYPTEGMMRIEAFSALAFGAQGIVYWKYRSDDLNSETGNDQPSQSNSASNGVGSVNKAVSENEDKGVPVNDGITTSVWESIKKINEDINKENDKFFNCTFINHRLCDGNHEYGMNGKAGIDKIKASGRGFLMTRIETPDPEKKDSNGESVINKYIVIVSRDPFNSQELQWLKVKDSKSTIGKDIYTPVLNEIGNNNYNSWCKETLPPGGYKIFKI